MNFSTRIFSRCVAIYTVSSSGLFSYSSTLTGIKGRKTEKSSVFGCFSCLSLSKRSSYHFNLKMARTKSSEIIESIKMSLLAAASLVKISFLVWTPSEIQCDIAYNFGSP